VRAVRGGDMAWGKAWPIEEVPMVSQKKKYVGVPPRTGIKREKDNSWLMWKGTGARGDLEEKKVPINQLFQRRN